MLLPIYAERYSYYGSYGQESIFYLITGSYGAGVAVLALLAMVASIVLYVLKITPVGKKGFFKYGATFAPAIAFLFYVIVLPVATATSSYLFEAGPGYILGILFLLATIALSVLNFIFTKKENRASAPVAPVQAEPTPVAPVASAPVQTTTKFCTTCGAQMPTEAAFCTTCGAQANVAGPTPVAEAPVAEAPVAEASADGAKDIDFAKYAPMDQDIEYDPNEAREFVRCDGFVGSAPQKFVNTSFPKCPLCQTTDPHWTISQKVIKTWRGNLDFFKCSKCNGVITVTMPDVESVMQKAAYYTTSVGIANMAAKKKAGKNPKTVYVTVEYVGTSGVNPAIQGKEFTLAQVQEMAER
jgi:hypothetical protein